MRDDFGALFAANGSLRADPSASVLAGGLPCGPFDQKLLNELFFTLSSLLTECNAILDAAGIVPDEALTNQLLAAIRALTSAGPNSRFVGIQSLTTSSNYTPTAGAKAALAYVFGGGASGGSGTTSTTANGGGGGGGGLAIKRLDLTGVSTIPYTIGLGGAAAVGSGVSGNAGGTTTLGPSGSPLAQATGGTGGIGYNGSTSALGQPGAGIVGDQLFTGNPGQPGTGGNQAGNGGGSPWGGGGTAALVAGAISGSSLIAPTAGSNGGGGGGGPAGTAGTVQNSAAGGNGRILMVEFA